MTARRRRIAGLLLALVVGALAVVWFGSRGGRVDVHFAFLGFTNVAIPFPTNVSSQRIVKEWRENGVFLITNAGSRPVRVEPFISFIYNSAGERLAPRVATGLPADLAAGDSLRFESPVLPGTRRWQAEIAYTSRTMKDRLAAGIWSSTNAFLKSYGRRLLAQPGFGYARSDWIANSSAAGGINHITAPPPDMSYDLPAAPKRD